MFLMRWIHNIIIIIITINIIIIKGELVFRSRQLLNEGGVVDTEIRSVRNMLQTKSKALTTYRIRPRMLSEYGNCIYIVATTCGNFCAWPEI